MHAGRRLRRYSVESTTGARRAWSSPGTTRVRPPQRPRACDAHKLACSAHCGVQYAADMATSAVEVDDAELVTGMSCLRASHSLSWTRPRLLLSNAIAHSRWIDFALGCSCITRADGRRATRGLSMGLRHPTSSKSPTPVSVHVSAVC